MGLGMPPLLDRLFGLLLLPGKRICVGDVGDLTESAVLGRAERLRGCVPSSYIKDTKLLLKQGRPNREMLSTLHKRQCTRGYYCRLISTAPPRHGFCIHSQALCHAVASWCSEGQALFGLIKTLSV